jgi:hypothetical protein
MLQRPGRERPQERGCYVTLPACCCNESCRDVYTVWLRYAGGMTRGVPFLHAAVNGNVSALPRQWPCDDAQSASPERTIPQELLVQ